MNSALPSPYPAAGEVIDGKYRIEKVLGEGGMGCVARATHLILRSTVALKFMNPQYTTFPGAVDRFINEGVASKRIRSSHVVPVDDVGKLPSGAPYLVMPCLEGKDLADLLAADGTPGLATPRAVHFVLQILLGLEAAHAVGIVHRDMKPSNCFVVKHEGEADFVKILDFGISKVREPGSASLTQTNSALGTPLYMSPEQAKSPKDVDARSDLYSVGVILYELLTGHTPFFSESGEFTEILFKLFTADPPPVKSTRPDLPDALATAVHKALAREVDNRFSSAKEMAEAIAPFADQRSAGVLHRIRNFVPEQARSMPPPSNMTLPGSMEVFSRLDAKPSTDVMAHRPTTDVQKGSPFTQVMDNAPRPRLPSVPDASITPPESRNRALDVLGRTQVEPEHAAPPAARGVGVSTDLGATRDAPLPDATPKRSPLIYILPVFALFGLAGVFLTVGSKLMAKPASGTTATATATSEPPASATNALPLPSSTPSAAPSSLPSAVASAAPSASAPSPITSTPKSTAATNPNTNTNTTTPPPKNSAAKALGKGIEE